MSRVKQGHRRLENELYSAEKMVTTAWLQGLMPYPQAELEEVMRDLAFVEFHDILPGSAIPAGEEGAVRMIGHGLEILSRLKARAFFALAAGEPKAAADEIPIFVFNPHAYPVRTLVECEFEPWEPNFEKTVWAPKISARGKALPSQAEKEESNLSLEWRKRVVFEAELAPGRLNRFSCRLEKAPEKPEAEAAEKDGDIAVTTADLTASVNTRTGLLDAYRAGGIDFLEPGAFRPLVIRDNADPWGMKVRSFRTVAGELRPGDARGGGPLLRASARAGSSRSGSSRTARSGRSSKRSSPTATPASSFATRSRSAAPRSRSTSASSGPSGTRCSSSA